MMNPRNTLRHAVLAAVLGAGVLASHIAGAQTAAGEERQPAGPPNPGDARATPTPGPDPKQGPAPRAGEERPLIRQPSDRTTNPGGAPSAGDTRPPRGGSTGKDRDRTGAYTEPRYGGPDAGVAKSGVKP